MSDKKKKILLYLYKFSEGALICWGISSIIYAICFWIRFGKYSDIASIVLLLSAFTYIGTDSLYKVLFKRLPIVSQMEIEKELDLEIEQMVEADELVKNSINCPVSQLIEQCKKYDGKIEITKNVLVLYDRFRYRINVDEQYIVTDIKELQDTHLWFRWKNARTKTDIEESDFVKPKYRGKKCCWVKKNKEKSGQKQ